MPGFLKFLIFYEIFAKKYKKNTLHIFSYNSTIELCHKKEAEIMQLLTFTLNDIRFGVPVEDVQSIENRMDVVGVPNAPAHFEGIIDVNSSFPCLPS